MRKKATELGMKLTIDSAGTAGYHAGCPPDKRSIAAAAARGYDLTGLRCRQFTVSDFDAFDHILVMDEKNYQALEGLCTDSEQMASVDYLMRFSPRFEQYASVPDPYYGGKQGFDLVLELIESAVDGWLQQACDTGMQR